MAQQPLCFSPNPPLNASIQGGYYNTDIDKQHSISCSITRAAQEAVVLFSDAVAAVGLYVVLTMSPECRKTSPVVYVDTMCVIYQRAVTYPKSDQSPLSPQPTNPTCSIPIRDGFYIPFMKPSPKCPLVFLLVTRHSVPYIVIIHRNSIERQRTFNNNGNTTCCGRHRLHCR